jgi:YggT family protein
MSPLGAILFLLQLYFYVVIIDVILSWLINFQVINKSNQIVRQIHTFTFKLTDPAYRWIRQVIPPIGGLDLSPLVLIIGIQILEWAVIRMF